MHDLVRAQAMAVRVLDKARQHPQGFLLRHGEIYPGKKGWTIACRHWLTTVRFQHAEAHAAQTGQQLDLARLVAPMLARFMATDRGFTRVRNGAGRRNSAESAAPQHKKLP